MTTTTVDRQEILDEQIERRNLGRSEYAIDWRHRYMEGGAELLGTVIRHDQCEVFTTTTADSITEYQNTNTNLFATYAQGVIGVVGAGFLVWGIKDLSEGKPFSKKDDNDRSQFTPTGHKVFWGSLGSLFLVSAGVTGAQSIDTSDSIVQTTTSREPERCHVKPAGGAAVVITKGGEEVATGRADAAGNISLQIPSQIWDESEIQLAASVDGIPLKSPLVLGKPPQNSETPEGSELASGASSPGTFFLDEPSGLRLLGVRLKGAARDNLVPAITKHGAELVDPHPNKTELSLDANAWHGLKDLTIIFDSSGRFVKARFGAQQRIDQRQALFQDLRDALGEPEVIENQPNMPLHHQWALPNDMVVIWGELASDAGVETRLTIADREAEARVRAAIGERDE